MVRIRAEKDLNKLNVELEQRIKERTTELSLAMATLQEREGASEQLAAIVESSDDAIIRKDLNSIITSWNKGADAIFGYTASEMVGTSIMRLIPTDRQHEENQFPGQIKLGQNAEHFETLRQTKDGRLIDVSVTVSPIKDAMGKVIGVSKVARDITERKAAEEALRQSEARLQTIVENLSEGLAVSDLNGQLLHFNRAALDLHGFASLDECRRHLTEFADTFELSGMDGKIWPVDQWPLARILRGEKLHDQEVHIRRVHTDWQRVFSYGGTLIHDAGNRPTLAVVTITDITERKQAERTLRVSEEWFRTLVEQSLVGIYVIQDGKFVYLNPKMEEIFGVSSEELRAQPVCDFVVPEDRELVRSNIDKRLQKLVPSLRYDLRILQGNGDVHSVEVHGGCIEYGGKLAIMGTMLDITERKRVEEEIGILNVELEQRVVQRTGQLQAANEELKAFSFSVSHDLRAPLRQVMGFVKLLQQDAGPSLSEESLRHLTTISQSAKRMGKLIDDLLKFSRIGKAEMQRTEVNLDQLIEETVSDFEADTKERNIAWEIRPLPPVRADRALLRMVLINLISNAVKFTGARAEAKIEIGSAPSGDGETVIFIRDNGAGFDPKYTEKLFGVFQRLHSEAEFEGTGIGLANVQRIIHRHGGRAWAEGVVDGGATFFFSIPKQNGGINGN
jgi:PAS domain S-box-containing protein